MKRHITVSVLCIVLAAIALWWGLKPVVSTTAQVQENTVALLLDTDIGTGALQMKQGAKQAAREQKVDLITAAPDYAGGATISQAEQMMDLLQKGVKAIILVPAKGEDLSGALAQAAQQKVPVLALNEAALPGDVACVISDDSVQAGAMAARGLIGRLKEPGRVLLITGDSADAAAGLRLKGALPVLNETEGLSILSQTELRDKTVDDMVALLGAYPGLNGILCLTGESTEIAAQAMGRLTEDIVLMGMDCGQNRTTYLENRQVDAMVLGMPFAMGYLGVQFAAQTLQGGNIPDYYYTESRVIDLENMYLPENQKLAFPMLQ